MNDDFEPAEAYLGPSWPDDDYCAPDDYMSGAYEGWQSW